MSLINQMLRDLEQRRTAEMRVSPLGGLSASGSGFSATRSIDYLLLSAVIVLAVAGGFLAAYILSTQEITQPQQAPVANILPVTVAQVTAAMDKGVDAAKTAVKTANVKGSESQGGRSAEHRATLKPIESVKALAVAGIKKSKPIRAEAAKVKTAQAVINPVAGEQSQVDNSVLLVEVKQEPADRNKPSSVAKRQQSAVEAPVETHSEESINKTVRPLTSEQQSQLAFQRAVKMLGRGKQQAAESALEEALSFEASHLKARETLAALLLNTGRVSEAANTLREGLQLMSGATPLAKLYARILVDQGESAAAVAVLEKARPTVSAEPDYYALLAALYRQVGKHAQASQVYQQILTIRPGVASWWMGLGLSQEAMGENQQAREAFQRAQRAGGLGAEVLKYVQSRILALTPAEPAAVVSVDANADVLGE